VTEPSRPNEFNDRQCGEQWRLTCPSLLHVEACQLGNATPHPH
jgi:hypothetical protein